MSSALLALHMHAASLHWHAWSTDHLRCDVSRLRLLTSGRRVRLETSTALLSCNSCLIQAACPATFSEEELAEEGVTESSC